MKENPFNMLLPLVALGLRGSKSSTAPFSRSLAEDTRTTVEDWIMRRKRSMKKSMMGTMKKW